MSAKEPFFVFFGTPKFSVTVLDALERHGMLPALVVTAPDKPQGRGLVLTPSPVKVWATERGIDVLTPTTLKDEMFIAELQNNDWDIFCVAAYAKLIPKNLLEMPRRGCLNVHPSLLPKFRGPSPALSAILADERGTGVTIMQMAEKMDAGPIIAQARVELEEDAWPPKGSEFEELLSTEGGNLLAETIPFWINGEVEPEVQNEDDATFTRKFTDTDSLIDLNGDPHRELLKIRTFDKNPRAHFITSESKRVIITDAELLDGKLNILRVIPEGKKEMDYADYVRANS